MALQGSSTRDPEGWRQSALVAKPGGRREPTAGFTNASASDAGSRTSSGGSACGAGSTRGVSRRRRSRGYESSWPSLSDRPPVPASASRREARGGASGVGRRRAATGRPDQNASHRAGWVPRPDNADCEEREGARGRRWTRATPRQRRLRAWPRSGGARQRPAPAADTRGSKPGGRGARAASADETTRASRASRARHPPRPRRRTPAGIEGFAENPSGRRPSAGARAGPSNTLGGAPLASATADGSRLTRGGRSLDVGAPTSRRGSARRVDGASSQPRASRPGHVIGAPTPRRLRWTANPLVPRHTRAVVRRGVRGDSTERGGGGVFRPAERPAEFRRDGSGRPDEASPRARTSAAGR